MHQPLAINWAAQEFKIRREEHKRSEKKRNASLLEQHQQYLVWRRAQLAQLLATDYETANEELAEKGLAIGIERM
jgi:hypothetical protein